MTATITPHIPGLAYLSTPYTLYRGGMYHLAYMEACQIAARLMRSGVHVFSPIAHSHSIGVWGDLPLDDGELWMPFDRMMMERCDCLIVARMPGWQESIGMAEEITYFEEARLPIFDLYPGTLIMIDRKHKRPERERYEGGSEEEQRIKTNDYLQR